MKTIMISIKSQWVEKILNGEKTIEIRKTMPKCELPCKGYIYCTKKKPYLYRVNDGNKFELTNKLTFQDCSCFVRDYNAQNGKVVAEFELNKITTHLHNFIDCAGQESYNFLVEDVKNAGFNTEIDGLLDFDKFVEKYGKGKPLFSLHVEDLKIYDKPKELSEFDRPEIDLASEDCRYGVTCPMYKYKKLKRPPQSWCYVEQK